MRDAPAPDRSSLDANHESSHYGSPFWVAALVAAALMGWGAALYLDATPDWHRRWALVTWIVGLDLAHDLLVAPLICLVGVAAARWVPRRPRRYLRAGLVGSTTVLVLAWLPLHGTADVTRNPTIQPLDYGTATLTALALVWATVAAVAIATAARRDQP